ncbi:hypothetical protein Hypma_011844 [Hypsizygus marmoreus]|uniref:Uncharacterized protein n=1 Tax=Hypsizygus marmoreus TaxID=39966 RepID=A0A369JG45_HYPMA|nr:hypothetical protein Hypma_011844 [Hypsizygus marmoreus]
MRLACVNLTRRAPSLTLNLHTSRFSVAVMCASSFRAILIGISGRYIDFLFRLQCSRIASTVITGRCSEKPHWVSVFVRRLLRTKRLEWKQSRYSRYHLLVSRHPLQYRNNSYDQVYKITMAAESDIWDYNLFTKEITTKWVNTNGSPVNVETHPRNTALCGTGDLTKQAHTAPFFVISPSFVPEAPQPV